MRYTRRQLVQSAAYLVGAFSSAALVEACTPAPTSAPAPAQPTAAPAAKPTIAAAAPTTAAATAAPSTGGQPVAPMAAAGKLPAATLTIGIFAGPEADAHVRLGPKFTDYTQGKIKVQVEQIARDDYDAKWLATMQSRSSTWDVVHDNATRFKLSGPAGFFQPRDKFMSNADLFNAAAYNKDDYPPALLQLFNYKNQQYLIPQEASALMLFYRTDLLQKYAGVQGPPETGWDWDTLISLAKQMQPKIQADGNPDLYPLLLGVKSTSHAGIHELQFINGAGAEIVDSSLHPQFSSEKAVAITQKMTDMLLKDKLVSPAIVGWEYPEVLTAFQQGRAVIALQWNASAQPILDPQASPLTAKSTAFHLYPYDKPAGPDVKRVYPSVHAIGISAFTKQPEVAFEYVAWFTSQATARDTVVNGGGSSGRKSLLSDPAVGKNNPQLPWLLKGLEQYHGLPDTTADDYIINNILSPDLNAVWAGQTDVKGGLQKADSETTSYLQEKGILS